MKDTVVIITGGSSGIGLACALEFQRQGAKVVISGRDAAKLQAAAKPGMLAIPGDVSSEADCKHLIEQTLQHFGRIDILINNAGISMRSVFKDTHLDVLRKLMDINFWGTVYCTKYAMPELLRNKGSVVGISSIAGKMGLPARTGYSASKFAMEGFLETIRTEHLHDGLHVLVVCPGFTASNIRNTALSHDGTQQGESPRDEQKMMSAEEVAKHIASAVLSRKRDLVLTTEGKLAVWVRKFMPAFIDTQIFNKMKREKDSPLNHHNK